MQGLNRLACQEGTRLAVLSMASMLGYHWQVPSVRYSYPLFIITLNNHWQAPSVRYDYSHGFYAQLYCIPGRHWCVLQYDSPRHRVSTASKTRISSPNSPVKGYFGHQNKLRKSNIEIKKRKDPMKVNISKYRENMEIWENERKILCKVFKIVM